LGNVDSAIYGVPSIGLTRRQVQLHYILFQFEWTKLSKLPSSLFPYLEFSNFIIIIICLIQVLEKYQVYGDSVLLQYGLRPTVRDIVKV